MISSLTENSRYFSMVFQEQGMKNSLFIQVMAALQRACRMTASDPKRTFGERSPVLTVRPAQTNEQSSGPPLSPPERVGVQNPGISYTPVLDLVLGYNEEITPQRHHLAE